MRHEKLLSCNMETHGTNQEQGQSSKCSNLTRNILRAPIFVTAHSFQIPGQRDSKFTCVMSREFILLIYCYFVVDIMNCQLVKLHCINTSSLLFSPKYCQRMIEKKKIYPTHLKSLLWYLFGQNEHFTRNDFLG